MPLLMKIKKLMRAKIGSLTINILQIKIHNKFFLLI